MRLHPAVSEDEALVWLQEQLGRESTGPLPDDLDRVVRSVAAALAAISSTELADDVEPYFP